MRMRSALMVAVYEKQLKLSNIGRKRHSTGEVMNYIAVDAYRMGEFPLWFHCQLEFMVAQEKRLRLTSAILNNMKVIKLQSWEEKFKKVVESCRDIVLFGCALLRSAPLDAATIFTILATLRTMYEPDENFAWDPESTSPTLRNVNLEVKRGQKVAVCGSVGSGKSSMLYLERFPELKEQ
ncbi:ABC transporter C family member 8-like protein isoform X2 [Tanacetum coccineum]